MFEHLMVTQYKGLENVKIDDLGHINVICGKNNSGKTSILEALNNSSTRSIGKKIDSNNIKWLNELAMPQFTRYSNPNPSTSQTGFMEFLKTLQNTETVWYSEEQSKISESINVYFRTNVFSHVFSTIYNLEEILIPFFKEDTFSSTLIPPKRQLDNSVSVDLMQDLGPNGTGLINKLFKYKNNALSSSEYRKFDKISKTFFQITHMYFDIHPKDKNVSIYFKHHPEEEGIRSDLCGLGLSDILIIITHVIDSESKFLFIEEPENHIHPDMQRSLLNFITTIKSKQFLLSTHSSVFLNPYIVDQIYYVNNYEGTFTVSNQTSKSEILYNLGYSVAENLVSDFVLLTEGPTDIPILEMILTWLGLTQKYNIKYWPLGGDNMAFVDLTVFSEQHKVAALIDSDPGSRQQRTRFTNKCKESGIKVHKLQKYSIENYFSLNALKEVFPEVELDSIDPKTKLETQLGFEEGKLKKRNKDIIKRMTLADFSGTDLLAFCQEIQTILEQTP